MKIRFSLVPLALAAVFVSSVVPAAFAQAGGAGTGSAQPTTQVSQPITTGSEPNKMDAGTSNSTEEGYRHSAVVKKLAGAIGQPVERTATALEDLNSGIVIVAILYFLLKYMPGVFKARRQKLAHELADAETATKAADERLRVVEARLTMLDTEIEALRVHAATGAENERKRIEASLETEKGRIVHAAEQEIAAAGEAAQRDLKKFAADLAVERAMSTLKLSAEDDQALIEEFAAGLGPALDGRQN